MFCTKCGNQIKDGFKFCPKCGTPVYVEKEKVESEAKAQEEEVKKETLKKEPETKKDEKVKVTGKPKSSTSSKRTSTSSNPKQNYVPNPMIVKELNIEGVKNMAERGDKSAILQQAFRYELVIGVEKDVVKANEFYSKADRRDIGIDLWSLGCLHMVSTQLCVTKEQSDQYLESLKTLNGIEV